MNEKQLEYSLNIFSDALDRLEEALQHKPINQNDLVIDGSIQRFEFCFELAWKTIKRFLTYKGIEAKTPRDCFKEAFKLGWLSEGDDLWSRMIDDRNKTSHTYNRELAQKVYDNLGAYHLAYRNLFKTLRNR